MSMKYELEEPFFEEKGKITNQKEIGDNRSQTTFSAEGTDGNELLSDTD